MTIQDKNPAPEPPENRFPLIEDVYSRGLSVVMMLLGLRQWALIVGLAGAAGLFESMSAPWQIATMHMAVIDLVAAVGLWMRATWGNVLWIYAALSEIALHTVFMRTFGTDFAIVGFHLATIVAFVVLTVLARRAAARESH